MHPLPLMRRPRSSYSHQVELADFLADFLGAKPQPRPMLACLSDPYMQTPCPILSYYRVLSTEVLSYYRVCTV